MKLSHHIRKTGIQIPFITAAFLLFFSAPDFADDAIKWNLSKEEIIKSSITETQKYEEFSPDSRADYENKIISYIITLAKDLKSDINVLSVQDNPVKDYLFIKNKLCSIKELHTGLIGNRLNEIMTALQKKYTKANFNPGSSMDIYSIDTEKTKIIVHYYKRENKCIVYYYDSQLFRNLSSGKY